MTLFDCDNKAFRLKELEQKMGEPSFWDNQSKANETVQELKRIKAQLDPVQKLAGRIEDATVLWEMAEEEDDHAARAEVDGQLDTIKSDLDRIETLSLLGGKYDDRNCFLSIYAREGGTEAQDWCEMLFRMYLYYCEAMGWGITEIDKNYGEEAGLKDVTLHIKGPFAFGYLSAERGVHRLARVSPFNAQGKRQTSFAAVEVVPEFPESGAVEVDDKYLETEVFARSSGPGGQNVNKVATAVRLVYRHPDLDQSIMVVCSAERKLEQNKKIAMGVLMGKLEYLQEEKRAAEIDKATGGAMDMGWGSQIRSYVFYDNRVKDHRTSHETSNPQSVLDGDLQGFIDAELNRRRKLGGGE